MAESEGIAKNIFNIIDACYYIGEDAVESDHPDARNGKFAVVYGPDKEILDTGWSSDNAWIGLHQLSARWYSDINENEYGISIEYWKRDKEGNETRVLRTRAKWNTLFSDEFGNGIGLKYFTENYQYRIIIKSYPSVPENKFVAVDYIRIIPTDMWAVKSQFLYAIDNPDGAMTVQNMYPEIFTVTGNGTSYTYSLPVNIPQGEGIYLTVPVATVLNNINMLVHIYNISEDWTSFDIVVTHRSNSNWSGEVDVCVHLAYFPILGQL